jgi:hypothetical protein
VAFGDADASTPAYVKANGAGKNATTASFTPPAGALLVAFAWHDTAGGNNTNTSVVTDSLGGSWSIKATRSKQSDGAGAANSHVQISTSTASGSAMTVTTTGTNTNNPAGLYVLVLTGADTTTPMDVTPVEGTTNGAVVSTTITTTTDGARCYLMAIDWNVAAAMTAGAGQTAIVSDTIGSFPDDRTYLGVTNAVTSPAGVTTLSTGSPSSGNTVNWIGIAVRPAAAPSGASPTGLAVPVAFGSPTTSIQGSVPTGLAVPAALGSPTTSIPGVAPSGLAVPVAFGSPTTSIPSSAPTGLAVPAALGSPTTSIPGVAPTGLAVAVSVGSPTIPGPGASPAGIAVPVALGQPTATLARSAEPSGVAVSVALGTPHVGGGRALVIRPTAGTVTRPSTGFVIRP